MVYCSLLEVKDKVIKYAIGGYATDITGVLVVDMRDRSYYVEKEPDESKVYPRLIGTMIRKYISEFEKGNYPDKMSYEI